MNAEPTDSLRQVLAHAEVKSFLASRFVATIARTAMQAVVVWHVTALTGDPIWLGVLGAVQFLPVIPFAMVGGSVADRMDRRGLLAASQAFTAAGALVLAWSSSAETGGVALVLATVLLQRVAWTFEFPATTALLPALVPTALFPRTVVLSASVRNFAAGIGPLCAGAAIHLAGVPLAFLGCAIGLVIATALLARLRPRAAEGVVTRAGWGAVREGLDFVRQRPVLLGAMTLDMVAVILADPTVLLAVFAEDILRVGPLGFGVLGSSMAFGTLVMGVALLFLPTLARPGRALLFATLVFGAAACVFGLSRDFGVCVAALAVAGMADQISQVTRTTLIQLSTPDALRGRVGAVNMVFISASNELGAAVSGFLAAAVGTVLAVVGGGAACMLSAGVMRGAAPALAAWRTDEAVRQEIRRPAP